MLDMAERVLNMVGKVGGVRCRDISRALVL